jgi:4-amino-4-deoxy-L-arabinose transferase-like glycosyltransferase
VKAKSGYFFLILIIALGFVLRLWGINFGLPNQFHQDEPIVVNHALAYGSGDLNPHFFAIPPFASYILFFIYGVYFLLGKLLGLFQNPDAFAIQFFKDPTIFYLLGRFFIGVIPGTICIGLIYSLYKKLFSSNKGALFTAAVIAFSFLNVLNSHYIYVDMFVSLFVILGLLQMVKTMNTPSLKNYIFLGVIIGLATGTKYNAGILIAPFFLAHLFICKSKKESILNKKFILSIISSIAAFFLVNPFALLDFKFFINSLMKQGGSESYIGWVHHIRYSLRESIGLPLLILGLFGLLTLFIKDRRKAILLFLLPAIFYLHLVFFSQHFPRYALPLLPFFAIWSAYFLFEYLLPRIKRSVLKFAIIGLSFLIFIPLVAKSIKADLLFSSQDTRIDAAKWIKDNIDIHSKIALDHTFFRPAILQNEEQIKAKYELLDRQKGLESIKNKKLNLMLEAQKGKKSYYLYFLSLEPEEQGQFLSTMPALPFDYDILKEKGIDYVVINYADRQTNTGNFYRELKEEGMLIASLSPYKDKTIRMSYDTVATTCMPVSSKEIFSRIKNGSALEIYKIKR